jgi:hypothetical protein
MWFFLEIVEPFNRLLSVSGNPGGETFRCAVDFLGHDHTSDIQSEWTCPVGCQTLLPQATKNADFYKNPHRVKVRPKEVNNIYDYR